MIKNKKAVLRGGGGYLPLMPATSWNEICLYLHAKGLYDVIHYLHEDFFGNIHKPLENAIIKQLRKER